MCPEARFVAVWGYLNKYWFKWIRVKYSSAQMLTLNVNTHSLQAAEGEEVDKTPKKCGLYGWYASWFPIIMENVTKKIKIDVVMSWVKEDKHPSEEFWRYAWNWPTSTQRLYLNVNAQSLPTNTEQKEKKLTKQNKVFLWMLRVIISCYKVNVTKT